MMIIYNNNYWFWIELQGAGKQYFILEKPRDQFTLGSIYTSLVPTQFLIPLLLTTINSFFS